jgi:Predicted phosphohydrolases
MYPASTVYMTHALRGFHAEQDIKVSFSVIGDVHGNTVRLERAVRDLHGINPKLDALVLNGDIVDQGFDENYKSIGRCLKKLRYIGPDIVIKNIGNHEYYDYKKGVNSPGDVEIFKARYLKFSGEDNVYHDTWIKGYHFISLGSEQCHTPEMGTVMAFISDRQQKWLEDKLCEGYEKGKPIFVFIHQPLDMDISKSKYIGESIKQDEELKAILCRFPEVIVFSSHTHAPVDFSNSPLNQPIREVNTGALNILVVHDGSGGRNTIDGSQGLYVEVYKGRVVIRGRDFKGGSWIGDMEYKMDSTM